MNPVYRFYINYNSVVTEVFPLNFLETLLVDELERGQVFYRRKFNGPLTFGGKLLKADFNLFWTIEQAAPCGRIDFLIYRDLDLYFEGYFATSKGSFDLDECTFTVTPLVEDDYVEWFEKGSIEFDIFNATPQKTTSYFITESVNLINTRLLIDVIEYIADQIVPGTTVVSTFLNDATNPITQADNRWRYITVAAKADVKRVDVPVTELWLSFNGLMNILRIMNLRWDFNGSDLIIEHVSYFTHPAGIDIRTQKIATSTNKYRYLEEEMPMYERFSFAEADRSDFIGQPIYYDSLCVNQDSLSNSVEFTVPVTTDLEYIAYCCSAEGIAAGLDSNISDDGFVLLATYPVTPTVQNILVAEGAYSGETHFNNDLSWANLHNYFFKHDRILMQGYMNGSLTDFHSAKKAKEQKCNIIYCSNLDPVNNITTELGETYFGGEKAWVKKAEKTPYGEIALTLIYGPEDTVMPAQTYPKTMVITEKVTGTTSTFYAYLSEPADADLSVNIALVCKDTVGNTCNINDDLLVSTGDYVGSVAIIWCDPASPPPVCVSSVTVDMTLAPGWDYSLVRDDDSICP